MEIPMHKLLRKIYYTLVKSPLNQILAPVVHEMYTLHYVLQSIFLKVSGERLPSEDDILLMKEQVTFIYKSFQRQKMAVQLYKNIQKFYPGVSVIIADDSQKPLNLQDDYVKVIQLPFNSGLSKGINFALAEVRTPFVIRMDDDELLTLRTNFHHQLRFLLAHPEADLVAVHCCGALRPCSLKKSATSYQKFSMNNALKKLKIPHLTYLDDTHAVYGKVPQVFVARTEAIRSVGYDDNIRMIDHHEFFFRAAGKIVYVLALDSFVFHRHNHFDRDYSKYRSDIAKDKAYISSKIALLRKNMIE